MKEGQPQDCQDKRQILERLDALARGEIQPTLPSKEEIIDEINRLASESLVFKILMEDKPY